MYKDENGELVTLVSEEGTEEDYLHVLTFKHEGEKYVALTPAEDADKEEAGVLFMRIETHKLNGEDTYATVENEVLIEELFDVFCELMDEIDDVEEDEG